MSQEKSIAKILLDTKAVTVSPNDYFTWTSGIKAPIYCDNRLLISYPKERTAILDGFKNTIKEQGLEFDIVAGTATAAIPWAAFLASDLGKPMVYVRPKPKDYGAGKQVEGTMPKGSRVLIVEDLIATGGSSIKSAEACKREYDAEIVGVLAITTHSLPSSKKAFSEASLPLFTLTNYETLMDVATETGYLSEEEKEVVLKWHREL